MKHYLDKSISTTPPNIQPTYNHNHVDIDHPAEHPLDTDPLLPGRGPVLQLG